jgi:hypothetical protein
VFDAAAAGGVIFRAATGVGALAIAAVQQRVRRRLLRLFVQRTLMRRFWVRLHTPQSNIQGLGYVPTARLTGSAA